MPTTPECGAHVIKESTPRGDVLHVVCPYTAVPGLCPYEFLLGTLPPGVPIDPTDLRDRRRATRVQGTTRQLKKDCPGPGNAPKP